MPLPFSLWGHFLWYRTKRCFKHKYLNTNGSHITKDTQDSSAKKSQVQQRASFVTVKTHHTKPWPANVLSKISDDSDACYTPLLTEVPHVSQKWIGATLHIGKPHFITECYFYSKISCHANDSSSNVWICQFLEEKQEPVPLRKFLKSLVDGKGSYASLSLEILESSFTGQGLVFKFLLWQN
jgi:hypothetical protein